MKPTVYIETTIPTQSACLALVKDLPLLAVSQDVADIAAVYQARRLMPKPPVRDALHLALSSYYRMDYLLTWNCRHLANARKAGHLEKLNARMGLNVPRLVTPDLLRRLEEYS